MDSSPNVILTWYLIHGFQQCGGERWPRYFLQIPGDTKGAQHNREQEERSNSAGTQNV